MTSSLRRKLRIIRPRITAMRTAISLALLGRLDRRSVAAAVATAAAPERRRRHDAANHLLSENDDAAGAAADPPTSTTRTNKSKGPFPLPPSVIAVIKRAEKERIDPKELFAMKSEAQINQEIIKESGATSIYSQFPHGLQPAVPVTRLRGPLVRSRGEVRRAELRMPSSAVLRREECRAAGMGTRAASALRIDRVIFLGDFFFLPYHFAHSAVRPLGMQCGQVPAGRRDAVPDLSDRVQRDGRACSKPAPWSDWPRSSRKTSEIETQISRTDPRNLRCDFC